MKDGKAKCMHAVSGDSTTVSISTLLLHVVVFDMTVYVYLYISLPVLFQSRNFEMISYSV